MNMKLRLIVEITKKVSVVRILFQISGNVIMKNCFTFPAPSRAAASYRFYGMEDMLAIYMTM